jgi:hypothetical protein
MARLVRPEPDPVVLCDLVEADGADPARAFADVGLRKEAVGLCGLRMRDGDVVRDEVDKDGLGRGGHVHAPLEVGVLGQVRHRRAVVEVKVRHQQQVDRREVRLVEKGQALEPRKGRVDAAVKEHLFAAELEQNAREKKSGEVKKKRKKKKEKKNCSCICDNFNFSCFFPPGSLGD